VSALILRVLLEKLDTSWATRSLNYVNYIPLGGERVYEEWGTCCGLFTDTECSVQKHVICGPALRELPSARPIFEEANVRYKIYMQ
jgi:hypothetical protein